VIYGVLKELALHVVHHISCAFVDDYSRAMWLFLLIDKKEVSQILKNFFLLLKGNFISKLKLSGVIMVLSLLV